MEENSMKLFYGKMPLSNYFNENQRLIRTQVSQKGERLAYMDFYLADKFEYPNPNEHMVVVMTTDEIIQSKRFAMFDGDPRLELRPGYQTSTSLVAEIPAGMVYLINKYKVLGTTNPAGPEMFNRGAKDPSNTEHIRYSITPSVLREYTTVDESQDKGQGDVHNENFGLFITDNAVYLKGPGEAMIVLGEQGISFHGKQDHTNTKGGMGLMQNNPLAGWIPETIVSFPLSIPYIPNIDKFLAIGSAAHRLVSASQVLGKVTKLKPPGV